MKETDLDLQIEDLVDSEEPKKLGLASTPGVEELSVSYKIYYLK